ncbi:MAG: universal stress protein [Ignavibacteriales bacterium]|nr:universal stress protein [Ignavibacteriales bacterium]MCF8369951.1 universal stress protein [Bacteroidales bacterium]MCF8406092.1 universal stress protein [Bacteroidales bacterium]
MEDKIITITTSPYSRAQLIKGKLESEGIECFLSNINLIQPGISSGVKIKIKESDADVAYRIIEEIRNQSGKEKQEMVSNLKSIRRILVPVDFSEVSLNACNFALALAGKLKAEIKLLYSYFDPLIGTEPYIEGHTFNTYMDQMIDNIAYDAKRHLIELKSKIKEQAEEENLQNVKISYSLDKGDASDVIMHYIEKYKPGIVVMGTRGSDSDTAKFIGSVTRKVIEKSRVPVLAIPSEAKFQPGAHFLRVLYATNFDQSDFKSLRELMTLTRPFNMKIYCTHIAVDEYSSVDAARMDSLKVHLKKEYSEYDISCEVIRHENVIEGLQHYIEDKEIDMIALTTRKRGIFERFFNPSLARKMLFHSHIPLLIFQS